MTGSPASITPSEPGSTQSGRPMTSVAAQAVTPTAAVAAAQRPSALPIGNRPPCRTAGTAAAFPLVVTVSSTRTSSPRLLRTVVRVLGQARHHQLGQGGRDVGADGPDVARRLAHVRRQQSRRRVALERRTAGDQLVRHDAERVEVHAVVGVRVRRRLLGGHVGRRADGGADLGQRGAPSAAVGAGRADRLGDAEVGDRGAAAGEEDVVGLDVAVDDALRVGVGEGAGDVAEDADHLAGGHRSLLEPAAQSCRRPRTAW